MVSMKKWPVCIGVIVVILLWSGIVSAEENSLQRIQREGVLHAATEPAFEPFEFMKDGKIVGYGTDIAYEIAKRMGVRLDLQGMSFSAVLPSLITHKVDLAATTIADTPERKKKVAFTRLITNLKTVIVTSLDNNIESSTDFAGKNIGIQQGSIIEPEIKRWDEQLTKNTGTGIGKIIAYQAYPEILLALLNKQVDATAMPLPMAVSWLKKYPNQFKIIGDWESEDENCAWAVRKEDTALKQAINEVLIALQQDGTLETLQVKWFGKSFREF